MNEEENSILTLYDAQAFLYLFRLEFPGRLAPVTPSTVRVD